MDDERYGINIEYAHPRAFELIPDEFFWDCVDELAPFGSDEGDTALEEYRQWRRKNSGKPLIDCLKWTIEKVGEMHFAAYSASLLNDHFIAEQLNDKNFDFQHYVNTLDISIIATGFGQFADEGKIDASAKPVIAIALNRQLIVNKLSNHEKGLADLYNMYLTRLKETLEKA